MRCDVLAVSLGFWGFVDIWCFRLFGVHILSAGLGCCIVVFLGTWVLLTSVGLV